MRKRLPSGIKAGEVLAMISRSEIRGVLTGLAVTALVLLVGGTVWPLLPGQPLLQTLRFHSALLCLALAIALAIAGSRWRAGLLALLALLSVGQGGWIIYGQQQARQAAAARPVTQTVELVSFNILNNNTENGPAIAGMLAASSADVAFTLESAPLFPELGALAAVYPYRIGCEQELTCDLTMFSRTPLEDVQTLSLSNFSQQRVITARTRIGGEAVTLVAVHLTKPYFDMQSEAELRRLRDILEAVEGPAIIAGDFNAAPWSYAINRLVRGSQLQVAPFYPSTWPPEFGPLGVPIDNVFTRGNAVVESLAALPETFGSNHRGLRARIGITAP
ncbi:MULTISPECIES: endonuclease/exonuclease/phosphatase family protein [unclassified Devosia]|uniref:endonuclease/exonuclease/phosphatase family protein n=1 Tax=unclassified Devosia TaxID=196773 RepID=UPI0015565E4B|nr:MULTISPECIES: endonuclease/exonuclease/phosphatase family protein [unclassified Devosia]